MTALPRFERLPAPRYAPARDLSYLTEVAEVERVANVLGKSFMPWQRLVIERGTEYTLDALGRRIYRYHTILVTVPRQSGKTTLVGPLQLHRMIRVPNARCFFTAQTGKDAGARIGDLMEIVGQSPMAGLFTYRLQAGDKGLDIKANGSRLRAFAPVNGALHGETPLLVTLDEIWKLTREQGENLVGGFSPAQITLHGQAQKVYISTMGTLESGFMNDLIERGRAGSDPGLAYFEWSLPDGRDPYDEAAWWEFHPALGNTITVEGLRAETGIPTGEWVRAYCNRVTNAENPLVEPETWDALKDANMTPPDLSTVALAYEAGATSSVVATWRTTAGQPCTRVVHSAPGSSWLPDYLDELAHGTFAGATLAADGAGPSARITDELTRRGLTVRTLSLPERGIADGQWLTEARDTGALAHDGAHPLASAIACAVLRTTNGVERISRDDSPGDVSALIASSVGLYVADHPPEQLGPQLF